MRTYLSLVRESTDRSLPSCIVPDRYRAKDAPRRRYRLRIDGPDDARQAAHVTHLPVRWLTDADLRAHGAPVVFRARVLAASEVASAIDSTAPVLAMPLVDFPPANGIIGPEQVAVILLRMHPAAARYYVRTNIDDIDVGRLFGMVIRAGLERPAHGVGLGDWMPGLPAVDPRPLPRSALRRMDREDYGKVDA